MNFDLKLLRSFEDDRVALDVLLMAYWFRVYSASNLKHLARKYL